MNTDGFVAIDDDTLDQVQGGCLLLAGCAAAVGFSVVEKGIERFKAAVSAGPCGIFGGALSGGCDVDVDLPDC